jgi:hypothetical protein
MWVNKWWIVGITGFAAVAVVLYILLTSSIGLVGKENITRYTATTIVLVDEASGAGIPFSMYEGRYYISSLPNSSSLPVSYGNLAKELINESSFLIELEKAYNLPGLDPVGGILKAEYDKVSGLLRISYTANDPVKAKELSIEAYKLIQIRFASLVTDYAMEEKKVLEKKLEETRETLLSLEYKINLFQKEYGSLLTSDTGVPKNLSKNDFEQYMNLKLERDIKKDLLYYLPRYLLLVSLKDDINSPVFKLTGEPELPSETEAKTGVSGKVLITVVIFAAFFLSIMLVFILNAVKNIRNDPERMKKLKGIK